MVVISDWILNVMVATGVQIVIVVAGSVAALIVANVIERITFRAVVSVLGSRCAVYTTGWIGTTIHELSHLVVFLIFRIKVIEFKPFSPDFENETFGYVRYLADAKNPFHRLGCALAGIAPLAVGISLIFALGSFLVSDFALAFAQVGSTSMYAGTPDALYYLHIVVNATFGAIGSLLDYANLGRWQFWLFVYVSTCVACHFAPSRQDIRGIGPGILVGASLIFMVNAVVALFWTKPFSYGLYCWEVLGLVLGLLGIALGLSLSFCAAVFAVSIPRHVLRVWSAFGLF